MPARVALVVILTSSLMRAVAPVRSKSLSPSTVVIVTIPPTVESVMVPVLSPRTAVIVTVVPMVALLNVSVLSPVSAIILTKPTTSLVSSKSPVTNKSLLTAASITTLPPTVEGSISTVFEPLRAVVVRLPVIVLAVTLISLSPLTPSAFIATLPVTVEVSIVASLSPVSAPTAFVVIVTPAPTVATRRFIALSSVAVILTLPVISLVTTCIGTTNPAGIIRPVTSRKFLPPATLPSALIETLSVTSASSILATFQPLVFVIVSASATKLLTTCEFSRTIGFNSESTPSVSGTYTPARSNQLDPFVAFIVRVLMAFALSNVAMLSSPVAVMRTAPPMVLGSTIVADRRMSPVAFTPKTGAITLLVTFRVLPFAVAVIVTLPVTFAFWNAAPLPLTDVIATAPVTTLSTTCAAAKSISLPNAS